ncbi:MAG: ROK family protein [Ilumatobacteraceae bacterium]
MRRRTAARAGRRRWGALAERNVTVGVDVAVDSLGVAAIGLGGNVLHSIRVDRPVPASTSTPPSTTSSRWCATSSVCSLECRIFGVGVSVVGLVNRTDNTVAIAPNLGWRDVALGTRLHHALGWRTEVVVSNDADLAALAELRRGVAAGVRDVLYVWGEVGVGGGLISRGEPITGAAGFAGEIGHLPVNPDGRPCRCGAVGCWETEIGEGTLLERGGRSPEGGRDAVDALLADAEAGVDAAVEALRAQARWLGIGLAGLINVMNPSMVVLGGLLGRVFPFERDDVAAEIEACDRVVATAASGW